MRVRVCVNAKATLLPSAPFFLLKATLSLHARQDHRTWTHLVEVRVGLPVILSCMPQMGQDLRDLFDGADHHHQEGARCAAGRRCIDAADAASLPPPRRSHRLQPDRRLHSMCGRRPSGDAFASIFDASNPAELGSSLLAEQQLAPLIGVYAVVVVAAWEQVRLHRIESSV